MCDERTENLLKKMNPGQVFHCSIRGEKELFKLVSPSYAFYFFPETLARYDKKKLLDEQQKQVHWKYF